MANSEKINGKDISENNSLVKYLYEFIARRCYSRADLANITSTEGMDQYYKTNFKDTEGNELYVFADEEGRDHAPKWLEFVQELINIISFDEEEKENLFYVPGVKLGKDEKKFSFYISKNKARQILDLLNNNRYRNEAEIKALNPKFYQELYQLASPAGTLISNLGYEAPNPRKYGESEEEYENRLEDFYHNQTPPVNKEEFGSYRKPYPHELTVFDGNQAIYPTEEENLIPNQTYYEKAVNRIPNPEFMPRREGTGTVPGERKRVIDSNPAKGKKIRDLFVSARGLKNSRRTRHVILGTLLAGGAIIGLGALSPAALVSITGAAAIVGVAKFAHDRYVDPFYKRMGKKLKEAFRGKPLSEAGEPELEREGKIPTIDLGAHEEPTVEREMEPPVPRENPTREEKPLPGGEFRTENPPVTEPPKEEPQTIEIPKNISPEEITNVAAAIAKDNATLKVLNAKIKSLESLSMLTEEQQKGYQMLKDSKRKLIKNITIQIIDTASRTLEEPSEELGGPSL